MRILFINDYPAPYRVDFFNELGKNCNLTVLYTKRNGQTSRDTKWISDSFVNFNGIFLNQTKLFHHSISFEIKQYLKTEKFDLIVLCDYASLTGIYAHLIMKIRKMPYAIEADGGFPKSGRGIKEWLKKKLLSSASWWLSSGEITDQYFLKYGAKAKNIYRYPFSSLRVADILQAVPNLEEKKKLKEKLQITEEKVILSVGQYIHRKGYDILLNSYKYLIYNAGVYIVGGKPTDEYIDLKENLDLNHVHFVDFKVKEQLKDYYMAADIFVLPTREDIWGLVINEAMANGLPVITTDRCIAGSELVLNEKNGYIVPAEDAEALGDSINQLFSNDEKLAVISVNNLNKIRSYTIESMSHSHLEVFKSICGEGNI